MGEEKANRVDEEDEEFQEPTEFSSDENESLISELILSPSKPPPILENIDGAGKSTGFANDRDATLARVELEKRLALIKAWEDNEKTKADNKAYKKLSGIDAWENIRRVLLEAQLKQIEEKFEKKKAEYGEKMKNKMAIIHKAAEEKRAFVEADLGKDVQMVEETAAKFRATGYIPKKLFACFTC
ncbi:hypothetical protein BUALT_Bualt10G0045000 [Buddleja alternifolia]|uniref:Remorin C-terminal domain-containing protein n=1 Tax=Buddleja alternifolia TaxID=168488 RepID=A0AAV6WXH6_9LAMI|nr:hypothetical protein BUALT_Bualt10G0045000 [Buddleja alternifolia]